ncbi:hypothetical protein QR680_011116 [Steinernema hermaphroditum]|uniref:Uncharacterized protein n=1 Tax=Steinernema hermaphroditum TaxID=289476 RepID=A0AA39IR58_9BILA|nr:hypothetical protein QR680_011116 [Steinernema hermaphroditum]
MVKRREVVPVSASTLRQRKFRKIARTREKAKDALIEEQCGGIGELRKENTQLKNRIQDLESLLAATSTTLRPTGNVTSPLLSTASIPNHGIAESPQSAKNGPPTSGIVNAFGNPPNPPACGTSPVDRRPPSPQNSTVESNPAPNSYPNPLASPLTHRLPFFGAADLLSKMPRRRKVGPVSASTLRQRKFQDRARNREKATDALIEKLEKEHAQLENSLKNLESLLDASSTAVWPSGNATSPLLSPAPIHPRPPESAQSPRNGPVTNGIVNSFGSPPHLLTLNNATAMYALIQELHKKIGEVEKENAQLKNRVKNLESLFAASF